MRVVSVPNVLATRYAGADLAAIWSPEHKIVLERQLWVAVLKAQRDLGIDVPGRGRRGLRERHREGRPRLDRRPRADHPPRREGAHRGVLRARRPRAHPQGHDLAGPDRERRAAAGTPFARGGARPRRRRAGAPRPARRRARAHRDGRPLAQRRRPGDHPRQALRDGRRRDADRGAADRGAPRPLPAARDQGADGHRPGHARPARRRRRQARRPRAARGRPPRLRPGPVQRRPGLPALPRLRRRRGAGAAGQRTRPTSRPPSG